MRIILILLLSTLFKLSSAQPVEEVINVLEKKNFIQVEKYFKSISSQTGCATPDEMSVRQIIDNYKEVIAYHVVYEPPVENREPKCNFYQFNIITKDDEIIRYNVYLKKFMDYEPINYKLLKSYGNYDEVIKFQDAYEGVFFRKLDLDELFDNSTVFGNHCGITGSKPLGREGMEKIVNSGDLNEMFRWITSPGYERKLYGYEAYKILIRSGYILNDKERTVISNLKNFKGPVRTCRGCSYGEESFGSVMNEITNHTPGLISSEPQPVLVNLFKPQVLQAEGRKSSGPSMWLFILIGLSILVLGVTLFFNSRRRLKDPSV